MIAGKGHETGQIVGGETLPFDDAEIARELAASPRAAPAMAGRLMTALWTAADAAARPAAPAAADWAATGVSIDTRTLDGGRSLRRAARPEP